MSNASCIREIAGLTTSCSFVIDYETNGIAQIRCKCNGVALQSTYSKPELGRAENSPQGSEEACLPLLPHFSVASS